MDHRMWKVKPVHWIGDAPTSLHGNGASSFERTTRDRLSVTCALCRTLLARQDQEAAENRALWTAATLSSERGPE